MGRWLFFGWCLLATSACGSPELPTSEPEPAAPKPGSLVLEPLAELPATLSEVGLYSDLARLRVSKVALAYTPGYPLWSDGGEKARFLVLPEGTQIDASQPELYEFPLGTLLFKTFSYRTPASPDAVVPIETRLLRLTEAGWEFSAYGWNEAGTEADLLELRRGQVRSVLSDDAEAFEHRIPSRLECRQCHESAASAVLGLSELQLARSGELERLTPQLTPAPSAPYASLAERGPLTQEVLGNFVGNCVHCHNGSNGASSSFDLRPEVALPNLIDQPTASSATAPGIRVLPGRPEESILYLAVSGSSDAEVKEMPPLGVAVRDQAAAVQLYEWILALADPSHEP